MRTRHRMKSAATALALASALALLPVAANAATGSIRITITRAQFIVGGGSGTLHFKGGRYPLSVGGVSLGPCGAASVDLVARADNLPTAANTHGTFPTNPEAGRPGTSRLRNWQGVVLELRGRGGAKPHADLSGLQISLRR